MGTDRSKFKSTPVATMQQQEKAVNKQIRDNGDRTEYLNLEEGVNKVRIFPAHPESKSFIYPYGRWWLPREVTYEKNNETVTEIKRRPIYNAKIHGGAQKDVVEEYVKFTTKLLADETLDEVELKEKIEKLTHWKTGLRLKPEWVFYCHKYVNGQKQFGLMTVSNGVKNKLNELAITEDEPDAPIATDPFTDVDEGKAILITYKPKEKQAKDVYKATLEFRGNYALTDDELAMFEKLESLEKLFAGVYRRRDFDLAVAGLRMFDSENEFNTFDHDEWIAIVEELQKQWPEDESDETFEKQLPAAKTGDEYDAMDREALKKFIKKNNLAITVKSAMKDNDIREMIRTEIASVEEINQKSAEQPVDEKSVTDDKKTAKGKKSAFELAKETYNKKK